MNQLYRKLITIAQTTGAGTEYQVLLKVGASASAVGEDFDLGGNSLNFPAAEDDGGDFRFIKTDGTPVPFYIEKVTGAGASALAFVRVKILDDLSAGPAQIYLYYGSADAPNLSSAVDTYILYDGFNDAVVDTDKWTISSGSPTETGGELVMTSTNALVTTVGKVEEASHNGLVAEMKMRMTANRDGGFIFQNTAGGTIQIGETTYLSSGFYSAGGAPYTLSQTGLGGGTLDSREYRIKIIGTQLTATRENTLDGGVNLQTISRTIPVSVNGGNFFFVIFGGGAAYPGGFIDWVRVRKEVATPPTITSVGTQQVYGVDFPAPPVLDTLSVIEIASTVAKFRGQGVDLDGSFLSHVGFVYDTVSRSLPGDVVPSSSGYAFHTSLYGSYFLEEFNKMVKNLLPNTTYYVRCFGKSSEFAYGDQVSFTTLHAQPIITSVTPGGFLVDATGAITIKGTGFRAGATVEINGNPCTSVVIVNSETITCNSVSESLPQTATLVVENTDGQSDSINFYYVNEIVNIPAPAEVEATFGATAVRYVK